MGMSCNQNERKRPSGRARHRWEGNIRMYLKEIGISTRNLVDLAQSRLLQNPCECSIESPVSISRGVSV
jgi:hypothetical protein